MSGLFSVIRDSSESERNNMANPFSKGWKYLMASLDHKIDENADPKVQIQQAAEAARRQHQQVTDQAAAILGDQRQLEMKLDRLRRSAEEHSEKARTAIQAADQAEAEGDSDRARELNNTAEVFASQLVAIEQQVEETVQLHEQASRAAEQAQQQQKESEARLQEQLSQINQLRSQADQAAMQEASTQAMDTLNITGSDNSIPTMDSVREKIERRYSEALGAQELTQSSISGRISEIAQSGTDMKASARLAEIRAELGGGRDTEDSPPAELTAGEEGPVEKPAEIEQADGDKPDAEKPDAEKK